MDNVFHTKKYINDQTFKALDMKGNKRNNFEKGGRKRDTR